MAVSTVANAKALLKSAIRSDNPIIFFEHVLLYNVKGAPARGSWGSGGRQPACARGARLQGAGGQRRWWRRGAAGCRARLRSSMLLRIQSCRRAAAGQHSCPRPPAVRNHLTRGLWQASSLIM